ncbi:hypothetical protein Vafri_13608 [Volvox africanus]|nr:hypothetical protein Vafri_13608 [Volvox africanus]
MRCLGSLPPSQAERFAAAATAAGLPEPPPPPPRGKSLWQRLPELETQLLDVVQACLKLDPAQRPTAAQLLQMPYFSEIPTRIIGTPLEKLYGEHGAAPNGRTGTVSGRWGKQPELQQQQQPSRGGTAAAPPPPASSASRGVAVQVMSSDELIRDVTATATADRTITSIGEGGDGGGGGTRRSASVLLSTVAASLLGEPPAPPGGKGSVQLVPLLATPPAPPQGLDVGSVLSTVTASATATATATGAAASASASHLSNGAAKVLSIASASFKKAAGVSSSGLRGQPASPSASLSPQPPTATRGQSSSNSNASPRALPPISKQPSRRLASLTPTPPTTAAAATASAYPPMQATPTDMPVSDVLMAGSANSQSGVAALVRGRSSTCEGVVERPMSRPCTGKRPMDTKDAVSTSESGHELMTGGGGRAAATAGAGSRTQSRFELLNHKDRSATIASKESLLGDDDGASIDPQVCFGGAVNAGLGLLPDGADDVLSDGDGHISDDDELLEYFAAKSAAGSGTAAAGGVSRRAVTMPNKLISAEVPQSSTAGAGSGAAAAIANGSGGAAAAAAASGGTVISSASLRRMPVDALHGGVQGAHHALYGCRQVTSGSSSVSGATTLSRRLANIVMRTADMITGGAAGTGVAAASSGGDVGAAQQDPPWRHAKRATVGSYLTMPSQLSAASVEVSTDATSRATAAAMRSRIGAFPGAAGMDEALYRGPGPGPGVGSSGSAQAQSALHGGLPALHAHNAPHLMTTTTGTGLAPSSSMPYTTNNYGRTSVPTGGYIITGAQYNGSANVAGSGRRHAISRQVSVVFSQLMYDALPEIGTPGGAPDVPAGTPPRRRVVMSGFTPCRTAAARAAAEGIPPAAAMAAVLGEALQSTTTDISVACSPIHRSVDLLSPDRESGPHCDITAAAAATAAAVVALHRRQHRRQASMASLQETTATTNSSSVGGAVTVAGNAASAAVISSASYHTYQAANLNGDSGLILGSSAPTIYNHRMQRSQEHVAGVISSGAAATPVAIGAGRSPFQLMASTGNAGSVATVSPSPSIGPTYGTTPTSGTRVFQQTPVTPAARSRLASGNMARDSQGASSHIVRDGDIDSPSGELDPLGTWAGSGCGPAVATTAAAAGVAVPPQQAPVQPSTALSYSGLPPPTRGRLGRWVSGLIDSLPEDREVLHVAYGDWRGSYNDGIVEPGGGCDDAIQMLGADGSADWVAISSAAGVLSSGGGVAGTGATASASQLTLTRGPAGPWPPGANPRTTHSGSGVDPRGNGAATTAATATASILPPPPAGSPRMPSGRSRRNFLMAATQQPLLSDVTVTAAAITTSATLPAGTSQPLSRASSSPREERTRQSAPLAAEVPKMRERHASGGGRRAHGSIDGGGSGGGGGGGGKSIGKWPRAKAFLGGRLLSSLVRKFKDQSSEK